mgnify:CR=1 FL=1
MRLITGTRALLDIEEQAYLALCDKVPCPEFTRAGTWTKCSTCGRPYIEHPYIVPHIMLNLLCDGRVVKL